MNEPSAPSDIPATLTLKELVDATGESERTLRYYMQLGLLSGPSAPGPGARYSADNVKRVDYIRSRQRDGLGLRDIQREFGQQLAPLSASAPSPEIHSDPRASQPARQQPALFAAPVDTLAHLKGAGAAPEPTWTRRDSQKRSTSWPPQREQWERQALDDGIEVWVRRPLDPHRQKLLTQLLAKADELFGGGGKSRS